MKKITIITILLFVTNFVNSCKKDEVQESQKDSRIKQVLYVEGNTFFKTAFYYDTDRLIKREVFKKVREDDWTKMQVIDYTYNGNNVEMTSKLLNDNDVFEIRLKTNYTIENGRILEKIMYSFYNGAWRMDYRGTFSFSDGRLTQSFDYIYGGFYEDLYKTDYVYEGEHIKSFMSYKYDNDIWNEDSKGIFTREDNILINYTNYSKDLTIWKERFEVAYHRNSDVLMNMSYNDLDYDDNLWISEKDFTFKYDENELLIEASFEEGKYTYEYENGEDSYFVFEGEIYHIFEFPKPITWSSLNL